MHASKPYAVDYLRLKFTVDADLFASILSRLKVLMLKQWQGSVDDMERCHKVNVFRNYNTKANYYMVDIWDIGAEIFYEVAEQYGHCFQRVDIRHEEENATKDGIMDQGHILQRGCTSWNVNVYNTKPASKRMGRDRGGVGFAIGSHKSDLRIAKYIRGRERGAIEYQFQGRQLEKALEQAREEKAATRTPLGLGDLWADNLDAMGHSRYASACAQANAAADARIEQARTDNLRNLSQSPLWEDSSHRNVTSGDTAVLQREGEEESGVDASEA